MFRLQIEARLWWRVRIVMIASVALFLATVTQAQSSRPNGVPSPDPTSTTPAKTSDDDDHPDVRDSLFFLSTCKGTVYANRVHQQ